MLQKENPLPSLVHSLTRLALVSCSLAAARAELLVYEGFQYGAAGEDQITDTEDPAYNLLHSQPDGVGGDIDAIGLSGSWIDSSGPGAVSDSFLQPGSLVFGDFATAGNSVRTDTNLNNDIFSRGLVPTLSDSGTGEIWFSFLVNKLQNNFNAAEGGVALANQPLGSPRLLVNDGSDGLVGFGIGATTNGDEWTAYAWDGSAQVAGTEFLPVQVGGDEVNLLIGQIQFDAGAEGTDLFTVSSYQLNDGAMAGGSLNEITSLEVDLDQTLLTTLNVTRQVNTHYDEIRIGETLADVLAAGPAPVGLAIRSLIRIDEGLFQATLTGDPESDLELLASADLDFTGATVVTGLTQSSDTDPGTIGGPEDQIITTSEAGEATVRFSLATGPQGFLRAREVSGGGE